MKKTLAFTIIVLSTCLLTLNTSADNLQSEEIRFLESHEIQIQTLSSKVYKVECFEGEMLYGEFEVTSDGDLYPGDERKYDLWLGWGNGVDFFVFDQYNYDDWLLGEDAISAFEKVDVISLSWSITIDESGLWYIVYVNDSPTYIKTVRSSFQHSSSSNQLLVLLLLIVGGFVIATMTGIGWRLKIKKFQFKKSENAMAIEYHG